MAYDPDLDPVFDALRSAQADYGARLAVLGTGQATRATTLPHWMRVSIRWKCACNRAWRRGATSWLACSHGWLNHCLMLRMTLPS